jgi:S-adenosylmethionine hydrolase
MIAIFTDFGVTGPYLGQMKAALYAAIPDIPVVDIFPDLPVFDAQATACLLPAYSQYLPENSVCLCVVDPGVGSKRRGLIVEADGRYYVGPDNGLFSLLLQIHPDAHCRQILWQPEQLSRTFHGRDWFAPVAAKLANGVQVESSYLEQSQLVLPEWPADPARVVYIDVYGNAITGVRANRIDSKAQIHVGGHELKCASTFSDVTPGSAFWYRNSNGLVEIAVNQGSAAADLELRIGSEFSVTPG